MATTAISVGDTWAQGAEEDGAELFRTNCSVCHGKTGKSTYRDFTDPAFQASISDEQIAKQIKTGTSGRMPSFQKDFSKEELAALVRYIRGFGASTR